MSTEKRFCIGSVCFILLAFGMEANINLGPNQARAKEADASYELVALPTDQGQAVLPPRVAQFKIGAIGAMTVGQQGWIKPWAICQGEDGPMWLDGSWDQFQTIKTGSFTTFIKRVEGGYEVRDEDSKRHWKEVGKYETRHGLLVKVVDLKYNPAQDQPQ